MLNPHKIVDESAHLLIQRRDGTELTCYVDAADIPFLEEFGRTWCAFWSPTSQTWYVYCSNYKVDEYLLHRLLLRCPRHLHVDHIDHNGLNNRRSNLRSVTRSINQLNHRMQTNNTSGFRGVVWDANRGLFQARVKIQGKNKLLGRFKTAGEANEVVTRYRTDVLGCLE
jgi:HNH endonuclease